MPARRPSGPSTSKSSASSARDKTINQNNEDKNSNKCTSKVVVIKIVLLWCILIYLFALLYRAEYLAAFGSLLSSRASTITTNSEASIDDVGVPITLSWNNLCVNRTISDTLTITTIQPNSGIMHPGTVTAIMGGSGSGKSTFLRALRDKLDNAETKSGYISLNNKPVEEGTTEREAYSTLVGYVPQQDTMHDDFTIEENLQFSANWRLDNKLFKPKTIRGIVHDVMRRLSIIDKKDVRVGKGSDTDKSHISGGQKKRVNIGIELVADPSVLFLDEPTSGLDSTTTFQVIYMLKTTAKNASLPIAAVLHQPSDKVFLMFDQLILLARGGHMIYCGPTNKAVDYFSRHGFQKYVSKYSNPADFLMEIVEGILIPTGKWGIGYQKYTTAYTWWENHKKKIAKINGSHETRDPFAFVKTDVLGAGFSSGKDELDLTNIDDEFLLDKDKNGIKILGTDFDQQFRVLFYRSVYLLQKSTGVADLLLISTVAIFAAIAAAKQLQAYGVNLVAANLGNTAMALGVSMVAVVQTIPEFESERLMFERERDVGLNIYAYVSAKFLTSIIVTAIMPFIFVIVYNLCVHVCLLTCIQAKSKPKKEDLNYNITERSCMNRDVYLPTSIGTISGALKLYWMLVINTFTSGSHAVFISLIFGGEKAMLAAVLMLVFMNLASQMHPKLGEISFMHTFNLWALTTDAVPEGSIPPLTKKKIIQILLGEMKRAQNDSDGKISSMGAIDTAVPRMKLDDEVMNGLGIDRGIGVHAEMSMLCSGVLMRCMAIAVLMKDTSMLSGLIVVYLTFWCLGFFRVQASNGGKITEDEKMKLNDNCRSLESLSCKSEHDLDGLYRLVTGTESEQKRTLIQFSEEILNA